MRCSAAFVVLATAGFLAAFDPPLTRADDPAPTVTVTRTVDRTYQGLGVRAWAHRAVRARRDANQQRANSVKRGRSLQRLRRAQRAKWRPTVEYALQLASRVYGVPYSKMRAVAYCESTLYPGAVNGRYKGLFQLGWAPFGFSPFDPVASALSAAQTVVHDGSWRQWECG